MDATVTPQTRGDWTLVLTALIGFDGFQDRGPRIAGQSGTALRGRPDSCLQKLEERRGFGWAVEVEV
jgi:hypothetical protein